MPVKLLKFGKRKLSISMVIKIAAVPNGKLKYKGRRKYFKYISAIK